MISRIFLVVSILCGGFLLGNVPKDRIKKSELVGRALEEEQDFTLFTYAHKKFATKKHKKTSKLTRYIVPRNSAQ